ncbi:hypothetical protein Hanom_Chr04g00320151 [Helianthus anomalus]
MPYINPFDNIQSLLPPNSWLGLHPVPDHRRGAARAENSLTLSFGRELIGSHTVANVVPSAANVALVVLANGHPEESLNPVGEQKVDANGAPPSAEVQDTTPEVKEAENASLESRVKQGGIHLFPVPIKTQFGEKLEFQLSPSEVILLWM